MLTIVVLSKDEFKNIEHVYEDKTLTVLRRVLHFVGIVVLEPSK